MRRPFTGLSGIAAPMPAANINTDCIIPSSWLRTARADLAKGLFGALRYDEAGRERAEFVLNREPFRGAQILVAGENFGCGSSREAAVWALAQFGIRCVLAPSFADIFRENALRNGLLAAIIDEGALADLVATIETHPSQPIFTVNLPLATVTGPDGRTWPFEVPPARREALIRGEDEIDATLRYIEDIAGFHAQAQAGRPWLYRSAGGGAAP